MELLRRKGSLNIIPVRKTGVWSRLREVDVTVYSGERNGAT